MGTFHNRKWYSDEDWSKRLETEQRKRKEYISWCENELRLWILNDEVMYNRAQAIMNLKRLSVEGKVRALKRAFGNFDNGTVRVGAYVSYRRIYQSLDENSSIVLKKD